MVNYLFESSVCLVVFYLVFLLFFRKDPYLVRNRIYLISALLISLLIPVISLPSIELVQEISDTIPIGAVDWQTGSILSTETPESLCFWVIGYWIGFSIAFLYLIARLIYITRKASSFEKSTIHGVEVLLTNGQMATSVFFRTLLWDNRKELTESEQKAILAHELAHINQGHGYDIFFVEALKIVLWFNPVIYLLEGLIKQQHEFLSDKEAVKGIDISNYQNLMVNQLFSSLNLGLTSNFGQPTVKNRLIMLQSQAMNPFWKWKTLVVFPFIFMLVFFYSCDQFDETLPIGEQKVDNGSLFVEYEMAEMKQIVEWADGKSRAKIDPRYDGTGIVISGNVSADSGPLPGASILLKGTTTGTTTDMEGNFHLNLTKAQDTATLTIAFVGFKTLFVNL
ncbi:MAG: hypothetical protein ACJA2S_001426 [Cyclobacteriaceae bacterium]|jgi:hypothetical protein